MMSMEELMVIMMMMMGMMSSKNFSLEMKHIVMKLEDSDWRRRRIYLVNSVY